MRSDITPQQADQALRIAEASRQAVRTFPATPRWYGPALAAAIFGFLAIQDVRSLAVTIAAELVYLLAIGIMVGVVARRAPYQLPPAAWRRHWKVFAVSIVGLGVAGAACFAGLHAAGFVLPGTASRLVVAMGVIALDRWVRSRDWTAEATESR